jgi:hypothetical protein
MNDRETQLYKRIMAMYEGAGGDLAESHDYVPPFFQDLPGLVAARPDCVWPIGVLIVAFVEACRQLDITTADRDEARAQLKKIGRKAFWAARPAETQP